MIQKMLLIIAIVLGLVVSSVQGLTLDVTPATVEIGITRTLQVKCSTSLTTGTAMSSLISLIISRGNTNNSTFTEIAAINVFDSATHVVYDPKENVTATGKIDNNGVSYMTLVWDFPDQNKAGVYRCEANGVDHGGHPVSVTTGQTVTIISPSVDVLVKQVQVLTSYIEQVHSMVEVLQNYNLNNRINQIDASVHSLLNQNLNSRIDQVNTNVRDLQTYKSLWNTRLDAMKNSLFHVSSVYTGNGHRYLLSHILLTIDISRADASCIQYGGYLAEVDSYGEMQFIRGFISSYPENILVLTGGNDEATEGHWVNKHSGSHITYFSWGGGEPGGGRGTNCIYIYRNSNWQMADDPCYYKRDEMILSFLCEIPA